MIEKEHFDIVESSFGGCVDSINLKICNKEAALFSGSQVVYASTDLGEKVAIKIPLDCDQARHEWKGLKAVYLADVSIPTPIALIKFPKHQLAIVSGFVEGNDLYISPNPDVKKKVGIQVKKMHQNVRIDGKTWESSERSTFVYYDKFIFSWAAGDFKELQAGSNTISLLGKFTDTMEDFCGHTKPVFNHNDIHDGQIIVNKNGEPVIIDFGDWVEEGWLNDLGFHLFHLIRTEREESGDFINFLDGYLGKNKLSEDEKSTLAFYLLFISARALYYFDKRQSSYLPIAKGIINTVCFTAIDNTYLFIILF